MHCPRRVHSAAPRCRPSGALLRAALPEWWATAGRRFLNNRGQGDPGFFKGMVGSALVVAAVVSFSPHPTPAGGINAAMLCLGGLLWVLQIKEWRGPLPKTGPSTASARMSATTDSATADRSTALPAAAPLPDSPGRAAMPDPTSHPATPSMQTAAVVRGDADGARLGDRILVATGVAAMRGLLGRNGMEPGEGLYFPSAPFGALHSIGMRFPFDALYLDRRGRVRRVLHEVRPGRLCPWDLLTVAALELPAGVAREVRVGDTVAIRPMPDEAANMAGVGGPLGDSSGQVLGWAAIVLLAVMLPLVMWGLAQGTGRTAQSQLGAVAQAAAQAAMGNAQASAQAQVKEHTQTCTVTAHYHSRYSKRFHEWQHWYTFTDACSVGAQRTATVTIPLAGSGLSAGQWDAAAESALGCVPYNENPPPAAGHYQWQVCDSVSPLTLSQQLFWNVAPGPACNTAWQEVRSDLPGPTAAQKIRMVQCWTENNPPLAHVVLEWLGPPVTVSVQATAYPTRG